MSFALLEYFNDRNGEFARSSSWYYDIEDRLHSIGSFWQRLPLSTEPIDKSLVGNLVSEFYQRAIYKNTRNLPDVRFFPSPKSIIEEGQTYRHVVPPFEDMEAYIDYSSQPNLGQLITTNTPEHYIYMFQRGASTINDFHKREFLICIDHLLGYYGTRNLRRDYETIISLAFLHHPSISGSPAPFWTFSSSPQQLRSLAVLDAMLQLLSPEYQAFRGEINCLVNIAKTSGWISPYTNTCLVSDRPVVVTLDEEGRLHNETDASMIYRDGFSVYSWHGVSIPDYVIKDPERITTREIESELNIEIKRVLIDRYGTEKYLQDTHAKLIHSDGYGDLFRKGIGTDEPLVMVKVVNSTAEKDGTYKDYFIRVPPHITTAEEAVAWTGGFEKGSFEYLAES